VSPRTGPGSALRLAEHLIRVACALLPDTERADREDEWSAEAEAAAHDTDIRLPALRALRTLWFATSLLLNASATRSTRTRSADRLHQARRVAFAVASFANDVGNSIASRVVVGVASFAAVVGSFSVVFGVVASVVFGGGVVVGGGAIVAYDFFGVSFVRIRRGRGR
jgi:hypothetical protein